jgi:hypothetical protein
MFVRVAGLAVLAAGLFLVVPASAAPSPPGAKAAAQAEPVKRVAETDAADDDAACTRARRRLWVEGEGWVVRRITTCR